MLPASNRGAGMNMGFPDVCNTIVGPATVPIPYPNLAMNAQAVGFAPTVKVSMMNALNMGSRISMTTGDEAGAAHPTIKGGGAYTMGNPVVSINKLPAINLTCPTTGNNMNNPLGAVLVPSAVTVTYNLRAGGDGAIEALGAAIAGRGAAPAVEVGEVVGEVGVARVAIVSMDLATRLAAAFTALRARGARAFVVDLRGCPGGDADAALRAADGLVPRGTPLAERVDPDGDVVPIGARQGDPESATVALVVDGGTASAAELFAGVLQRAGRARLVGARTWGKGVAARAVPREDGGFDFAPVAVYRLPGGAAIEGAGVAPDVEADGDGALAAAIELARAG
jgi:carboxyl-terminal processing protease